MYPGCQIDSEIVLTFLRDEGKLTEEGILRFIRDYQSFLAEEGRIKAQKIVGSLDKDVRDMGHRGKVFENMVTNFGSGNVIDFNKIHACPKCGSHTQSEGSCASCGVDLVSYMNFPVLDLLVGDPQKGKLVSVATGRETRLWDKIQVLFDVEVDDAGMLKRSNIKKFNTMLSRLETLGFLGSGDCYAEYLGRAQLLVPSHAVDPMKVQIKQKIKDKKYQDLLVQAIISDIK